MIRTGTIINEYVLIIKIGYGVSSEVWLCVNVMHEFYAIKIFRNSYETAKREIGILEKIKKNNCRNCLTYVDYFVWNDSACLVQPLMAGSLYTIMRHQYPTGYPIKFIKKVTHELLCALEDIQTKLKITHADIKPENILLEGVTKEIDEIMTKINFSYKKYSLQQLSRFVKSKMKVKNTCNSESQSASSSDSVSENSYASSSIKTDSDIVSSEDSHYSVDSTESCNSLDEVISVTNSNNVIDKKYINDPHIKLADFGNFMYLEKLANHKHGDIQTRHYRAPEIILRLYKNEKIDIWALGCVVYELLTGKLLFSPTKTIGCSCDLYHLHEIQDVLGKFPLCFMKSRKYSLFFNLNGLLKSSRENIHKNTLKELIDKYTKKNNISDSDIHTVYSFIHNTLAYDINERSPVQKLLGHDFITKNR